jgi:ABC-2 type transport system ATP-binding protein
MLSIDSLEVRYGAAVVLRGLSLELEPGQVHGLMGRNGEGKTTLLDAVFGMVHPRAGSIHLRGAPIRSCDVGYLQAHTFFYPRITGREYLRIFQSRHPAFDVEAWSQILELPLDRLVERYSAGMQKKLALLGILSLDRPVLLLDEPFNGLDLESNHLLGRLLRMLAVSGKTILLTSHILESLTRSCDRIHLLASGAVAGTFHPGEFDRLDALMLSGATGEKLDLAHRLLAHPEARHAAEPGVAADSGPKLQ